MENRRILPSRLIPTKQTGEILFLETPVFLCLNYPITIDFEAALSYNTQTQLSVFAPITSPPCAGGLEKIMYILQQVGRLGAHIQIGVNQRGLSLLINNHFYSDVILFREVPTKMLESAKDALRPYSGAHTGIIDLRDDGTLITGEFRACDDTADWKDLFLTVSSFPGNGKHIVHEYGMRMRTTEVKRTIEIIESFFD